MTPEQFAAANGIYQDIQTAKGRLDNLDRHGADGINTRGLSDSARERIELIAREDFALQLSIAEHALAAI